MRFAATAISLIFLGMAQVKPSSATGENDGIRLVPVKRTPEAENVAVYISAPKPGEVMDGNPLWVQVRVTGYPLGMASQFDRADEIATTELGQTIHVVIDDHDPIAINGPALDPFYRDGWYYDSMYKFEVPYRLDSGLHVIRAFPARSFGEGLKGEQTFASGVFYMGSQSGSFDLAQPFLTYNEPSNLFYLTESKPVLLDFYVSNADLSTDGYKVRVTLDGKTERVITTWTPYYIYGLSKGKHKIRLQLLDDRNRVVSGSLNDITQSFTVH